MRSFRELCRNRCVCRMAGRVVRHTGKAALVVVVMIAVTLGHPGALPAQDVPKIKVNRTAAIDPVGDAKFELEVKMPTSMYTVAKANNPNTAVLLRRLGAGQHWAELAGVQGRFDDGTSTVVIEYTHRGLARPIDDDLWEIRFEQDSKMDLVAAFDNTLVLTTASNTDLGMASLTVRVEAPANAEDLQLRHGPERITYRLATPQVGGEEPAVDFQLGVRPQIMSCMAKSYSDERFANLWVARSVMKNTGDQTLKGYRVRFRVAGYSSWSAWNRSKYVLPGQTVVDAYFPVFDLAKLAEMSGARPAALEMEYEYQTQNGEKVVETDSRRVQLLGRNQVYYSSMSADEAVGYFDLTDNAPLIVASFVTHDDPVMQQLAGGVCRLAGGPAASLNNDDAVKYLRTLYDYLGASNIAYQTSPGPIFQGQFGQHIKYGRDVLRNRAGTCIDLAILYASACEAVGLETVVFLIPGHAFPAVYLPNGNLVAVETTLIGRETFEKAYEKGMQEAQEAIASRVFHRVEIQKLHDLGVHSLDLPAVDPDYLTQLGYRFDTAVATVPVPAVNTTPAPAVNPNPPVDPNPNPAPNPPVVPDPTTTSLYQVSGKWVYQGRINGYGLTIAAVLGHDGQYASWVRLQAPNGQIGESQSFGTFRVNGSCLEFTPGNGGPQETRPFELHGNQMLVQFAEFNQVLAFQRTG